MSKYDKFADFLAAAAESEIRLSFTQIEQILGFALPASKYYQAWWSNNPLNNVMIKVWLAAGFKSAQVDVAQESVVFIRTLPGQQSGKGEPEIPRSPLFGYMKETSIILPGVDLTEPADPDWGRVYEADYLSPGEELIVNDPDMSISAKIRELAAFGVPRTLIAKRLEKRYQHVNNVVAAARKKAS